MTVDPQNLPHSAHLYRSASEAAGDAVLASDGRGHVLECNLPALDPVAARRTQTMLERTERTTRTGSWEWDVASDTVTWSAQTYRFFGRDPVLGVPKLAHQEELYTAEDTQRLFKTVSQALADGQPYAIDLCAVRPDGELRYCRILGHPECDASGKVVRLAGSLQDITDEMRVLGSLATQQKLSDDIINGLPGVFYILDAQGCFIRWNPRLVEVSGYSDLELAGSSAVLLFSEDEQHLIAQRVQQVFATGTSFVEADLRSKSGVRTPYYFTGTRIASNGQHYLIGQGNDISERKLAQAKLQLAASVFTHAREGITITDASGTIVDVNDTFTRITGYSREDAIGQNPRILQSGRHGTDFYTEMWKALSDKGHWTGEVWNRRKNGEVYVGMETVSAVRDAAGQIQHYVGLFTDITQMKAHQQQLEHNAHFDALTNLPNRVLLADRLHQELLQTQRRNVMLAVVYLDLDGFKYINDHHGHEVGDGLLLAVSQHMKEALREGDTLARIGGDEFVAVLVDLKGRSDCEPVLARLLQAASQSVVVGDAMLQVSASIGVTLYPQDGADADLLMRHADQAMYLAKEAGKNRYHFFDIDSAEAIQTQRESLQHIRRAMDQREFTLYYQPKVNMKTGAVVGAEALIRWLHPQRGVLAPGQFLPLIENHAMAVELGEWVIDTALTQIATWRAMGLDLSVSVNVGACQLENGHFVARLTDALAAHPQVDPGQLELEILETSALEDVAQISELMHACLALGVGFALDDFGTGYSSLTYLKRLPAALLKIDQSFVRDMLTDADDLAIVQGVVGLAGAFHRRVIAEGVETAAHGSLLLSLNCELAQGYGIARPMPAADMPQWVQRWQTQPVWTA